MEVLASRGLTNEQICEYLGVSHETLYQRIKEYPEITEALKRGKAKGIAEISNTLFNQAKEGNVTASIFWLKCNAGWKEPTIVKVSGDEDGDPIRVQHRISTVAINAQLRNILGKE